jgi:hypothetical protein
MWYPNAPSVEVLQEFPQLKSGVPMVDTIYTMGLELLYRCKNLKGPGCWDAGLCLGHGYGVWLRDSVYIGLLSGHLIDPDGASNTYNLFGSSGFSVGW